MKKTFFLIFLSFLPLETFASDIHITEILFNPSGSDTGAEYIVIKNIGTATKELSGWQLYPDGIGYFAFPLFSLDAGASVKIFLRQSGSNSATALYHQAPTANMGNTSGSIALFSGTQHDASTLVDFIQYGRSGETWETSGDEAGVWIKGEFIATSAEEEGVVLRRLGDAHNAAAWQSADSSAAEESLLQESTTTQESTGGGGKVASGPVFTPKIRAFAGPDRASIAGAEITFSGRTLDTEDAPIESQLIRYVWNFGDGTFAEGKNVAHTYLYPGIYTATLMTTQGEEMMQDECIVRVGGNTIHISEVTPGAQGWIELTNSAALAVDVSKWYIEDARGVKFFLPQGTRIAAGGFAVIANDTTKLAHDVLKIFPIILYYQNGKEADSFTYSGTVSPELSVSRKENNIVLGEKTPGAQNSMQKTKGVTNSIKPTMVAKTSEEVLIATTTINRDDEREDVQQASVLGSGVSEPLYESKWLLASIVVGLFAGAVVTLFVRARRLPQ